MTLIGLRLYTTYRMLSIMFGISVASVQLEIERSGPAFDDALSPYIQWPSIQDW